MFHIADGYYRWQNEKAQHFYMNTQTITFYIFVMVSLFPMTAYGDFYNDVNNAYLPGEVKSIMVGEAEAPIVEVEAIG